MRRVCRAWNDSLKTLPGSVWKEWALQRFARLRLIAPYWQDQDWKQVYQQQLVAERRGVPDCAHQTRRSLDDFIFNVEIWSNHGSPQLDPTFCHTLEFEWAGRMEDTGQGFTIGAGGHVLRLWDPEQPPTGAWFAILSEGFNDEGFIRFNGVREDDEGFKVWQARVSALNLSLSVWVSRNCMRPDGSSCIQTVQLVDSAPYVPEGAEVGLFDDAELPAILQSKVRARSGVVDEEHETGGYTCRPAAYWEMGILEDLISERPDDWSDLTTDQLLFYLEHSVPWDE